MKHAALRNTDRAWTHFHFVRHIGRFGAVDHDLPERLPCRFAKLFANEFEGLTKQNRLRFAVVFVTVLRFLRRWGW